MVDMVHFTRVTKTATRLLALSSLFLATGCSLIGIGNTTEKLEKLGLKLERPASWKDSSIQSDSQYTDYVINIPQANTEKSNVEGHIAVSVVKPLGDKKLTIEDELNGLKKYISANVTEMKEVGSQDTQLLGEKAKRLTLQFRNSEDKSIIEKVVITLTVKNNTSYAIILDEDPSDMEKHLPVYENMAASMSFL